MQAPDAPTGRSLFARSAAQRWPQAPIFGYGFRPFFLAAGAFALLAVPAWLWILGSGAVPQRGMPPQLWHAHEMLFGFVVAAVAGFLLTAVPSWTGQRGFAGTPLLLLALAWLAGRTAFAFAHALPVALVAALELAFIPALAGVIAPPILRSRNRNVAMLAILAALWSADAVFMWATLRLNASLASLALQAATNVVLTLVTTIGGRIVPAFTANALRQGGQAYALRTRRWIERALPPSMLAVIAIDALAPSSAAAGALAAAVALMHGIRLAGWGGVRTLTQPIVWALHLAYVWLPLGFALKAAWLLTGAQWAQPWQHAFGIGVFAGMILAVATRASLGHTGRPLAVHRSIAAAYALVTLAAALRIASSSLAVQHYLPGLVAAGACWVLAFSIFLFVYAPILTSPRADGRPG